MVLSESIIEEKAQEIKPIVYAKVDYQDREDIMQEIRLAFIMAFPRFRGDSDLSTYAHSIAKNKVNEYLRNKYRIQAVYQKAKIVTIKPRKARLKYHVEINPVGWGYYRLSSREKAIFRLIGEGIGNEEIARIMRLSVYTVRSHIKMIYKKLQMHGRVKLALYSYKFYQEVNQDEN